MMKMQKKILLALFVGTVIKAVIILFFYQNVIVYEGNKPQLASGYGWDQLVEGMRQGRYEMQTQSGLSDIYDLNSKSYRPPIYPAFLFLATYFDFCPALIIVLFQSMLTSYAAYLGYRIVRLSTNKEVPALICLLILFLFPMSFLKSGTLDEGPLLLVFLLGFAYNFCNYIRQGQRMYKLLVFSGILMGLATMTRYTAVSVFICLLPFLLTTRLITEARYRKAILFIGIYILILSPWIYRNYLLYGKLMLSSGDGKILLTTQSDEFMKTFPDKSIDEIERDYLREFQSTHKYLSEFDSFALDSEFRKMALKKMLEFPSNYVKSLIVKLKIFVPTRYYARQDSRLRDLIYILQYYSTLLLFILAMCFSKKVVLENKVLLITLAATIAPAILYFMLSRHFYVPQLLMIIISFNSIFNRNTLEINTAPVSII